MKQFMDEDFLLSNDTARKLYHEYAEQMPIFDYHCHLPPKEIAENIRFRNIGHLMLGGDHYKWRAMSAFGIDDREIRGESTDQERFFAYAKAMPYMIGNPLYHWTHLELKRVFGVDLILSEKTAQEVWDRANAMLETDQFRAKRLIERFNVKLVCTTDDPVDSLEWHERIAADPGFGTKVLPAFRPDKALKLTAASGGYLRTLSEVSGQPVHTAEDVLGALEARLDFFHAHGARISDHGLDTLNWAEPDPGKADRAIAAVLNGLEPEQGDLIAWQSLLLIELGKMYAKRGWVQQYHMNAIRNNNAPMFRKYGPDAGFDSVRDGTGLAEKLSRLLGAQEEAGLLPKTVLYSLDPTANFVLASMAGNFQTSAGIPGKVQFGSAWWFNDQRDGMEEQMRTLANVGLLSTFIGMLTDSRSFISYPRHEYFRRILCNLIGTWVENGEYLNDIDTLGTIVEGICYKNAEKYFSI